MAPIAIRFRLKSHSPRIRWWQGKMPTHHLQSSSRYYSRQQEIDFFLLEDRLQRYVGIPRRVARPNSHLTSSVYGGLREKLFGWSLWALLPNISKASMPKWGQEDFTINTLFCSTLYCIMYWTDTCTQRPTLQDLWVLMKLKSCLN